VLIIDWLRMDCSKILKPMPLLPIFYKNNLIFIMPSDRKARIPFKVFIANRENYHNSTHSAVRKGGRIFNEGSHHATQSVATKPNKENRDLHDVEGTLEMQKMLLQKLARRENIEKGYQDGKYSMDDQETRRASEQYPVGVDLERWKREMAQALYTIWG
jgi:hypothetical protein